MDISTSNVKVGRPAEVTRTSNERLQVGSRTTPTSRELGTVALHRLYSSLTANEHGLGYYESPTEGPKIIFARPNSPLFSSERSSFTAIRTRVSQKDFDTIVDNIIPIPETKIILYALAFGFSTSRLLYLEGGSGIGKTFAVDAFAQLRYGPKAKAISTYCDEHMDVTEVMGKYVPANLKPVQLQKIKEYLNGDGGAALRAQAHQERGTINLDDLIQRAAYVLGFPAFQGTFVFQPGDLPRSMTATLGDNGEVIDMPDGPGVIYHMQEFLCAPYAVQQGCLSLRGNKGKTSREISLRQDGGRTVCAGDEFLFVVSTNPPSGVYKNRRTLDGATARGFQVIRLPEDLSASSMRIVGSKIFSFSKVSRNHIDNPGATLDLRRFPELSHSLGEAALQFHRLYGEKLKAGEPGRAQKIPVTIDSVWKVAEELQNHQEFTPDYSGVDMLGTLRSAICHNYILPLESKPPLVPSTSLEEAGQAENSLGAALMASLDQILTNRTTGSVEFRGEQRTLREVIEVLQSEAYAITLREAGVDMPLFGSSEAIEEEALLARQAQELADVFETLWPLCSRDDRIMLTQGFLAKLQKPQEREIFLRNALEASEADERALIVERVITSMPTEQLIELGSALWNVVDTEYFEVVTNAITKKLEDLEPSERAAVAERINSKLDKWAEKGIEG